MQTLPAIDEATLARMPETDQRELLRLLDVDEAFRARDDFTVYCRRVIPGFVESPFHVELCELLMAVERGDIRKLLVEAPVRIGKTRLISETAPAWCMARRSIPAMLCSYGAKLAHRSSRRVRSLIMSERHLSVFPEARLSADATSVDMFETDNGSSLVAAGTNGPIGGSGFLMGFLDDLLKGREAADSPLQRDAVWEWFQGDFMSREELPSGIVFVTARWHDDDPAGRIRELVKDEVEDWTIRTYAALDENDESLCEELRPAEELKRIRSERPSRYWQSLYMSDPVGESGDVYKRAWFVASDRRWTPQDGRDGTVRFYAVLRYRHDGRGRRFHGAYHLRGRCRRRAAYRRCLARTGEPGRMGGRDVAARVPLAPAEMGFRQGRAVQRGGAAYPQDDGGKANLCRDRHIRRNPRPGCALAIVRRANGKRPRALE